MSAEFSQHPESIPSPETPDKPNVVFGTYLPKTILTNRKIESWDIKTPGGKPLTAENILKRTGIEKRFVADQKETVFFMGLTAAREALNGKKADAIIVSTSFPQDFNVSERISNELGISPESHLDVYAACSGFTFSLAYIKEREKEFLGQKILLVATEKYSPYLHDLRKAGINKDPSLAQTIFSDGAIAMVFEYGHDLQVLSALNQIFPKDVEDFIKMPIDETRLMHPFVNVPVPYPKSGKFEQDGTKVYRLMCETVPQLIRKIIDEANLDSPQTIQMVVPHQGSGHMVNGISQRLNGYSVYNDFKEGNFSSGSIPKALMKAANQGEIKRGDNLVLAGFGAGMFASIAVVKLG